MITVGKLKEYGADIGDGLSRCMNNEAFYLKLVGMVVNDKNIYGLKEALDAGNLDKAFEHAHALKGVASNLALTPIVKPVAEMTELLRARKDMDYTELYSKAAAAFEELRSICE